MLLSTAEDLARFVDELRRETDRGLALVGAALIDDRLRETLRAFFREVDASVRLLDGANAPMGSFSARCDACHALGLIDDFEHAEIGRVRKVRNEFAHAKHGLSFQADRIRDYCLLLKSDLPVEEGQPEPTDARFRFTNAVVLLALRLYHRPDWVALSRRPPATFIAEGDTKWRSFAQNPPSLSEPFLAFGRTGKGS